MTQTCIETHQLSKYYGRQAALDQVSIRIDDGDIYGLIGRNGAGKTTLLKILAKQIRQSSGSFEIFQRHHQEDSDQDLHLGVMIESPGIYPDMTAYDNMLLKCEAMGIRRKNYIEDLLDFVELGQLAKKKRTKSFSLGMKQRLSLAMALVGDPDILLLDEPTNGLDPQGIASFRQMILLLNRERKISIIISSHILGELNKMVSKMGIIHEGQLIKEISKEELLRENRKKLLLNSNQLPEVSAFLEEELDIKNYLVISERDMEIYDYVDQPEIISKSLIDAGLYFNTLSYHENSLEEYFMALTGGGDHA